MPDEICNWNQEDDDWGSYETDCGQSFNLTDGTPDDNNLKFCCFCGKALVGHPFVWEDDDDD